MMLAPIFPRNALETANRLWFAAREANLPYTIVDALDEVVAAAREAEEWREEKIKIEDELYDAKEKVAKLEEQISQLLYENTKLEDYVADLEYKLEEKQ
jgi:predicted  nucleic acid-binding Zn-ribbon protein